MYDENTEELAGMPWYKNFRIISVILLIITAIIKIMILVLIGTTEIIEHSLSFIK